MSNEITYLIEKQAARIAELEAQLAARKLTEEDNREQIAALLRKIDEAPVLHQTHIPVEGNTFHFRVVSLIIKEDLQK